jgi:hypothetical protein
MPQTLRLAAGALVAAAALIIACSGDDVVGGDDAGVADATPGADGSVRDAALRDATADAEHDAADGSIDRDAGRDAGHGEGGAGDGGDAPHDGGNDASLVDAGGDAAHDASVVDAGGDASVAPVDAGHDASEGHAEAGTDASLPCGVCPFACVSGVCTGTCSPGGTRCESGGPELCLANGTWKRSVGVCTAACVAPPARFVVDLASLTVKDTATGLVWQRAQASLAVDWEQAKADCAALSVLGGKGRLPTLDELRGITLAACNPSTDEAAFPAAIARPTWTSTATDPDAVQTVSFATGASETHPHIETLAVRCLRDP